MIAARIGFPVLVPLFILALSIWIRSYLSLIPENYLPLVSYIPYILLIVSAILCFQFNQLRSLLSTLVLTLAYFVIQLYLQYSLDNDSALNAYLLVSLFLPLSLGIISWLPERGITTVYGLSSLIAMGFFVLLAAYLYQSPVATQAIQETFSIRQWSFSILAPAGIALYLLFLVHQLTRLWIFQQPIDACISAIMLALLINFIVFDQYLISTIIFSAIQLILIWGVLKHSHDMAYRDELTGLPGRRALNEALKSPGRKYVLAMMDIDHFKKFNDKYGHDVGDDVLKIVASKMALVTGGGKAYRYGGEEFTVLFKGKALQSCIPHLEAVREDIAHYSITLREKSNRPTTSKEGKKQRASTRKPKGISVSISIGVAAKTPELTTPEAILKSADKALYKAKKAGRNCLIANK